MLSSIKLFLISILVGGFLTQLCADNIVMHENFDSTLEKLKSRNWMFQSIGTRLVPDGKGGKSLEIMSHKRRRYAHIYFPIKLGKNYYGTVNIKCLNVKKMKKRDRGAILFFQLADKDKGHITGGAFPRGLYGNRNSWEKHVVPFTKIARKPAVKFINITIGIEGTGTAVFDDLIVMEMAETVKLLLPKEEVLLKNSRPEFKWKAITAGLAQVLVSKDPAFPVGKTFSFFNKKGGSKIRPDFALASGKWYWKVETFNPNIKTKNATSFSIAENASKRPATVFPLWKNEYSAVRPKLAAQIYPKQDASDITVEVAGEKASILSVKNGVIIFTPKQKLDRAVYDVAITVGRRKNEFIYSTVKNANKISFRNDKTMLINGKPFFPLGTYRDPNDSINDFASLKEAGFNLTHAYRFETPKNERGSLREARQYLRNAEKHNIKVFMGIRRADVKNININNVQRYCASLKGYKSLLVWYFYDEPLSSHSMIPLVGLENIYKAIKSVDKNHPVSLVFASIPDKEEIKTLKNTFDIFWTDNYPVLEDKFDVHKYYNEFLLKSKKRAGNKPFWSVIQAHDLNVWYGRSKTPKYPTPLQSRLLAHLSLAAGADGLIWYWSPHRMTYHIKNDTPEIWDGICQTVQEMKRLTPYLVGNRSKYPLNVSKQIKYWSASANGKRVLTLINISDQATKITVDLNLPAHTSIENFNSKKAVKLKNGRLYEYLKGYEVKIYCWKE